MNTNLVIQQLQALFRRLDKKENNPFRGQAKQLIANAVTRQEPLQLILFTCSTINSKYMFSKLEPWKYVSLNPLGNNLEADLPKMVGILKDIQSIYPLTQLIILIGNTDPYYIYLQQLKDFKPGQRGQVLKKFARRWVLYRNKLEKWIQNTYALSNVQVVSWYDFEKRIENKSDESFEDEFNKTLKSITKYFSQQDLDWEYGKLITHFGTGKYFNNLQRPLKALLKQWIRRKFAEYALQGRWIYEQFPNAILLQNEKPSDLRSKMYQPLIYQEYQKQLPVMYFFGVDNEGFQ